MARSIVVVEKVTSGTEAERLLQTLADEANGRGVASNRRFDEPSK